MKYTYYILLSAICLASFSCPKESREGPGTAAPEETIDSTGISSADEPATSTDDDWESIASFHGNGQYLRLEGSINDIPITVYLIRYQAIPSIQQEQVETYYSGYYYYDKYQEPIPLTTTLEPEESADIALSENEWYDAEIQWRLRKREDGVYVGAWYDDKASRKMDIELVERYPDDQEAFELYWISDKYQVASKEAKDSDPQALVNLQLLFPKKDRLTVSDQYMNAIWRIVPAFANADVAENFQKPALVLEDIYHNFKTEIQDELARIDEELQLNALRFAFKNHTMTILHHTKDQLSFCVERVHELGEILKDNRREYVNVNLSDWSPIKLNDVLGEDYENKLEAALLKAAKRKFANVPGYEDITINTIDISDQYAITDKGIWFDYVPGYFLSFDDRHQQVFIPFSAMD